MGNFMCYPIVWWWGIFFVILISGAFGGYARYQWEVSEGNGSEGCSVYLVTGVASSLLVPLFLNTISSSLIKDIPEEQERLFILIGFCVAAGAFAKQFIGSVAKKALELSQQASKTANEAKEAADAAGTEARSADNRAVALFKVLNLIDSGNLQGALAELETVIGADPRNSEAWAWKAYCLKRLGRFEDAITSIVRALEEERRDVYSWLYNLACYKSLAMRATTEVVATLAKALRAATPSQLVSLEKDLREDDDFARLRTDEEFLKLLDSLKQGV